MKKTVVREKKRQERSVAYRIIRSALRIILESKN